jgi:hypothetical protein
MQQICCIGFSNEAKMFKIRNMAVAVLCAVSVIGMSRPSPAEFLKGAERETFVANATKGCIGVQGKGGPEMSKPLFERYCTCLMNGLVDRIPKDDLMNGFDQPEWIKDHKAVFDEEYDRCLPEDAVRDQFIANATKACIGSYGKGKTSASVDKPLFEQYCGCVAKGVADRMSVAELKELDKAEISKKNDAIVDEESTRCLAPIKEQVQQKSRGRK